MSKETDQPDDVRLRCPLCGVTYPLSEAEDACGGCPLKGNCELVRCPNCGFETVAASSRSD